MKNSIVKLVSLFIFAILVFSCNKDTTAPALSILGNNPQNICVGVVYEDAGAVAIDEEDGDISDKIVVTSDVDSNVAGSYTVKYEVEDQAGNRSEATRTVEVINCK